MATQFEIDCALMAGGAYVSNRNEINRFPAPDGWRGFRHVPEEGYPSTGGFEAISYQSVSSPNKIVISFAGTCGITALGDNLNNLELATGITHNLVTGVPDQLLQAADYYLAVRTLNTNAEITFTGHSLGGGLAALMGVFFGCRAFTFDQAPFANSAEYSPLFHDYANNLKAYLEAKTPTGQDQLSARDVLTANLSTFIALRQANGGIPNSALVSTIRVEGELLAASLPFSALDPIGVEQSPL